MAGIVRKLYARSPVFLQNVACSLAGIQMRRTRYNAHFRRMLAELEQSQWQPLQQQQAQQNARLREIISHACATVPYYGELFSRLGLRPEDIQTAADLSKLPVLEKDTVRSRGDDLLSRGWPTKRVVHGHTGGTTGKSLQLHYDRDTAPFQWAIWWRHRRRFGLNLHDSHITFAGRDVVPMTIMRPPIWRRNLPMHQTYVSVHHLTEANMQPLADYLCRRRVTFYSGYPSGLYLVASYLLSKGIRLPHPPRMAVTGAETLLPHQREVMERAFQAKVADQYGASEHCGNISQCEHGRYHVDMELGVVEFLPIPGLPSNVRRIICTGLRNPVMPLIRYDIGDIATLAEGRCPCGRESQIVERIDGRIESYIVTPDGRRLGRLDFLFKDSGRISECQLFQESLDSVTFRIVRGSGYSAADEESLVSDARRFLGQQIAIRLEYLDAIPREANGKFRQIVSKVFADAHARPAMQSAKPPGP